METNSARAEARHLKAQLDECLGPKAERYWKLCREFHTENTLTKRSFDESVSTLLRDVAISVTDMTVSDEKGRSGMDISTKDRGGDAQHPDVGKDNTEEEEGSMVDGKALHNRFVMAVLKSALISQQNYRQRATDMQEGSKRRLLDNSSKTVIEMNDATKGSCKKRRKMSQGESTAGASPLRIRLPFTPATGHKSEDFSSAIPHSMSTPECC